MKVNEEVPMSVALMTHTCGAQHTVAFIHANRGPGCKYLSSSLCNIVT